LSLRVALAAITVLAYKQINGEILGLVLTTAVLAEVEPDELHHVRFKEVDVPPRRRLSFRQ
jgi:hypothetical protein